MYKNTPLIATIILFLGFIPIKTEASFSITPGGQEPREEFNLQIRQGESTTDSITIQNFNAETVNLYLYGVDGTTSNQGTFALVNRTDPQKTLGKWITLKEPLITLKANEKKDIPFTIHIPAESATTKYTGGIAAETAPAKNNGAPTGVTISSRVASKIFVEVLPGAPINYPLILLIIFLIIVIGALIYIKKFRHLLLIPICIISIGLTHNLPTAKAAIPPGKVDKPNEDQFSFTIANPNQTDPQKFRFELKPGESAQDYGYVKNLSDIDLSINLYGADETTTNEGGFSLKTKDQGQNQVGSWITFEEKNFTLKPQEIKKVKFTINVPPNIALGEYHGGVAAEKTKPDSHNPNITIAVRIGLRVDVKVTPAPQPIPKQYAEKENPVAAQWLLWISLTLFLGSGSLMIWERHKSKPTHRRRG